MQLAPVRLENDRNCTASELRRLRVLKLFSILPIGEKILSYCSVKEIFRLAEALTPDILKVIPNDGKFVYLMKLTPFGNVALPLLFVGEPDSIIEPKVPDYCYDYVPHVIARTSCGVIQDLPEQGVPNGFLQPRSFKKIIKCKATKTLEIMHLVILPWQEQFFQDRIVWPKLEEVSIEDVQVGTLEDTEIYKSPQVLEGPQIKHLRETINRSVPTNLLKMLMSRKNLKKLKLVSVFVSEQTVEELKKIPTTDWIGLKELHLEDIIVPAEKCSDFEDIIFAMMKQGNYLQYICKVTFSLQLETFGSSILDRILEGNLQFTEIHIILNMESISLEVFKKISSLNKLCEKISITFHRATVQDLETPRVCKLMEREMETWDKVYSVRIGKVYHPYYYEELAIVNSASYLHLFSVLPKIPNIREFELADRLDSGVLAAAAEFILQRSKLTKLTLAVCKSGNRVQPTAFDNLLKAIPPSVRSLHLLYFPLSLDGLEILRGNEKKSGKPLQHLIYFGRNIERKKVASALPKTRLNTDRLFAFKMLFTSKSSISFFLNNGRPQGSL